jgi:hypothetical protein
MNNNKKRYTIYLDEEPRGIVQTYLRTTAGMSFSGFLNILIGEFARDIQGQPTVLDKRITEMTLEEFGRLMNYWFIKVKAEDV